MKKAYVKPVFLAEEFVSKTSFAVTPCDTGINGALKLEYGKNICDHCQGDKIGGNGKPSNNGGAFVNDPYDGYDSYWKYATSVNMQGKNGAYLFNTSVSDYQDCDFIWNGTSYGDNTSLVYVWDAQDTQRTDKNSLVSTLKNFVQFFAGNSGNEQIHVPGYQHESFFSN